MTWSEVIDWVMAAIIIALVVTLVTIVVRNNRRYQSMTQYQVALMDSARGLMRSQGRTGETEAMLIRAVQGLAFFIERRFPGESLPADVQSLIEKCAATEGGHHGYCEHGEISGTCCGPRFR